MPGRLGRAGRSGRRAAAPEKAADHGEDRLSRLVKAPASAGRRLSGVSELAKQPGSLFRVPPADPRAPADLAASSTAAPPRQGRAGLPAVWTETGAPRWPRNPPWRQRRGIG